MIFILLVFVRFGSSRRKQMTHSRLHARRRAAMCGTSLSHRHQQSHQLTANICNCISCHDTAQQRHSRQGIELKTYDSLSIKRTLVSDCAYVAVVEA